MEVGAMAAGEAAAMKPAGTEAPWVGGAAERSQPTGGGVAAAVFLHQEDNTFKSHT